MTDTNISNTATLTFWAKKEQRLVGGKIVISFHGGMYVSKKYADQLKAKNMFPAYVKVDIWPEDPIFDEAQALELGDASLLKVTGTPDLQVYMKKDGTHAATMILKFISELTIIPPKDGSNNSSSSTNADSIAASAPNPNVDDVPF